MKIGVVILAAGKGTRMKSQKPKVLHTLLDKPMISYVLDAVKDVINTPPVLVVGHKKELIQEALGEGFDYVWQKEQKGTGHGLLVAASTISGYDRVLVVCGDTPLISSSTMSQLMQDHKDHNRSATVLSVSLEDPQGYGRILRDAQGDLEQIVEQKDAQPEALAIQEINSGMYVFEVGPLLKALQKIEPKNAQGEYYLTDVLSVLRQEGQTIGAYLHDDAQEIVGINDRRQLMQASRILQSRIVDRWLDQGVSIDNPSCVTIGADVILAEDVVLGQNVILEGHTRVGCGSVISANSRLTNAVVGQDCHIDSSVVVDSKMGDECLIGPFAYIRPSSEISNKVKIGDFVEIKKSRIKEGSKIPHHSYIGDAEVGERVNIGAGTITCNYDGVHKFKTIIEDGVFIGSNSNLVAPVHIKKKAYVAAGSTITQDVPEGSLSIARGRQKNVVGWREKKGI